jgi:hypothetical protein
MVIPHRGTQAVSFLPQTLRVFVDFRAGRAAAPNRRHLLPAGCRKYEASVNALVRKRLPESS